MSIQSRVNPAIIIKNTIVSGNFGSLFTTKRKCGWSNTNSTQNTAKYIIYGVKIERSIIIEKMKLYRGFGRFSPWIFEPSHNSSVGQKTNIISGVPDPAKNKKGVDKIIKQEASRDTLLLNHLFRSSIKRNPSSSPIIILGSLTVNADSPKKSIEYFCKTR